MAGPKWVVAFGVCTTGGFCDNYATVRASTPSCRWTSTSGLPRPETVLEGLMLLQKKIQAQGRNA